MRFGRVLLGMFLLGGAAFGFASGFHSLARGGSHCDHSGRWGHGTSVEAPATPQPP